MVSRSDRVCDTRILLQHDYLVIKRPKREAGHSVPAVAEVRSAQSADLAAVPRCLTTEELSLYTVKWL